mmetsp:Transcript_35665/g.100962  ORF Transcript_35665/g.100962 Transcript_35665/m.100962 type:complete len:374 (-) Transcript_35665:2189-3310(-)
MDRRSLDRVQGGRVSKSAHDWGLDPCWSVFHSLRAAGGSLWLPAPVLLLLHKLKEVSDSEATEEPHSRSVRATEVHSLGDHRGGDHHEHRSGCKALHCDNCHFRHDRGQQVAHARAHGNEGGEGDPHGHHPDLAPTILIHGHGSGHCLREVGQAQPCNERVWDEGGDTVRAFGVLGLAGDEAAHMGANHHSLSHAVHEVAYPHSHGCRAGSPRRPLHCPAHPDMEGLGGGLASVLHRPHAAGDPLVRGSAVIRQAVRHIDSDCLAGDLALVDTLGGVRVRHVGPQTIWLAANGRLVEGLRLREHRICHVFELLLTGLVDSLPAMVGQPLQRPGRGLPGPAVREWWSLCSDVADELAAWGGAVWCGGPEHALQP